MSDRLKLTPREKVTITKSSPEMLEVEGSWAPGGKPPPPHFHPAQDEHFQILAGTLTARADGEERELGPGDTLDVPRGMRHQMWNRGTEPVRAIWQTKPAGRTEAWFRSIDSVYREGRVEDDAMPGPLAFGVYLTEFRDVFRLAVGPDLLTRPLLATLGVIGRARGYRPET